MPRGTLSLGYGAAGRQATAEGRTYRAEPLPFVLRVVFSYGKGKKGADSNPMLLHSNSS
ncbi:hypothetical protein [Dictyobacter kobayashii]|uniref:hypothetical protein n=1 Tax=Dictyobacter kobayashii TaxID=2014872 RepID=UPI001386F10A|nr:hypothetical protein [Dictyobacter kobayashii]